MTMNYNVNIYGFKTEDEAVNAIYKINSKFHEGAKIYDDDLYDIQVFGLSKSKSEEIKNYSKFEFNKSVEIFIDKNEYIYFKTGDMYTNFPADTSKIITLKEIREIQENRKRIQEQNKKAVKIYIIMIIFLLFVFMYIIIF